MLSIYSWPTVILHLDGDAFFASVIQAIYPRLKGKPLVVGQERGIATAVSYEAKRLGVTRGMRISEIKKHFPSCLTFNSDYETYNLFSQKMFAILRTFSPIVEEYSVDEAFADLKGLRRPYNMSYKEIGAAIKEKIESSLGITISVGISLTKSLAKLASSSHKPSGLTVVNGRSIDSLLKNTKIGDVWGIGPQTSAYLQKLGIVTAYDFAMKPEEFVTTKLSKPFFEIWQELRGTQVYAINSQPKTEFQTMTRSQTFYPPITQKDILWSRINTHIEDAFVRARSLHYAVKRITLFLKTQDFRYHAKEIEFQNPALYPFVVRSELRSCFDVIYRSKTLYRTTGCTIHHLENAETIQQTLFGNKPLEEKVKRIYPLLDQKKIDFGTRMLDRKKKEKQSDETKLRIPFVSLSNEL